MKERVEEYRDMANIPEEGSRYRRLSGPLGMVTRILAIALPVYSFLFIMNLFAPLGVFIYSGTHNALFLGAVLTLVFLLVPAGKTAPRDKAPWYDLLFAALSLTGTLYIAINYEAILVSGGVGITGYQITLGLLTILALLEAVRRTMGWAMIIVVLFFIIHAKFTYLFPGILFGPKYTWARVMSYLYLSDQGVFGKVLDIAATVIISFMTFGAFLSVSGAGDSFVKLALALLGHVRGGPAKVAVLGSAMFGTMTGSPIAEVGLIGNFTIPLMKRIGYSPTFAGAVEAAAACGGIITPPVMGAVGFIMADFTDIPYSTICVAAIMPAILYFLSLYFQLDLHAAATGLVGLPKKELPDLKKTLKESSLLFGPIAVLVIWLMVFDEEPTTSVFIALGALIALTFFRSSNRMTWAKMMKSLENAGRSMIDITPICGLAGLIVGSVTLTGLGINLAGFLVDLAGGSLLLLSILTAIAIYVMGMGVSAIATYILMSILVAPAMVQMGVPVLVAHFFIFYMGVSMFITPPYAPAAYVAGAVAGADPMRIGYQAMKLAVVAYLVPFISVFQPALLWMGAWYEVAAAAVTAIIAIYALSVAFERYCLVPLKWSESILWLLGGFLLFYPKMTLIAPGLALLSIAFAIQWVKRKRKDALASGIVD